MGSLVLLTSAGVPAAQRTAGAAPAVVSPVVLWRSGLRARTSSPRPASAPRWCSRERWAGRGGPQDGFGALGRRGAVGRGGGRGGHRAGAPAARGGAGSQRGRVRGRDGCARCPGYPLGRRPSAGRRRAAGHVTDVVRMVRAVPMLAGYAAVRGRSPRRRGVRACRARPGRHRGGVDRGVVGGTVPGTGDHRSWCAGLGTGARPGVAHRATVAHGVLTGLTTGWACSAALGVAGVVADPQVHRGVAAAFAAVAGSLLVLRRASTCAVRRIGLGTAGVRRPGRGTGGRRRRGTGGCGMAVRRAAVVGAVVLSLLGDAAHH